MAPHARDPGYVYFVRRSNGVGPVKIGFSRCPDDRLTGLMRWSPYPLTVVATIRGQMALERQFHALFRDQHCHAEWFEPSAELERIMAAIAAGAFDVATLPAPLALHAGRVCRKWPPLRKARLHAERAMHRLRRQGVLIPAHLAPRVHWYGVPDDEVAQVVGLMQAFIAQFPASMTTAGGVRAAKTKAGAA